jgi:Zn-dependent M32 family carboxypeptidase
MPVDEDIKKSDDFKQFTKELKNIIENNDINIDEKIAGINDLIMSYDFAMDQYEYINE